MSTLRCADESSERHIFKRIWADVRIHCSMNFDAPILYERMLKAAANDKDSLREIREIISLTNDNIIPQDFLKLYEQFEKVVKQ